MANASGSEAFPLLKAPCRRWGPWPSAAWTLAALVAWFVAQVSAAFVLARSTNPLVLLSVALVSAPVPVAILWLAIRRAGCRFTEYMALNVPRRGDLLIGLGCLVVLLPLGDIASHLSGRDIVPPFVVDAYRQARDGGGLVLLVLVFVLAAPAMEEFIFRGFLLPGLAASRLRAGGAIALTSVCWAVMHVQYEVFFIVQIIVIGILFGWLRWRSNSTLLTMLLHGLTNLTALVETAYIVERIS